MDQVKIKDAAGKAIKVCLRKWDNSEVLLVFDDETYSILQIDHGYEPGDAEITDGHLNVLQFGEEALVDAGVLDEAEAKAMREKYNAECAAAHRERERQQYERLKRQFES